MISLRGQTLRSIAGCPSIGVADSTQPFAFFPFFPFEIPSLPSYQQKSSFCTGSKSGQAEYTLPELPKHYSLLVRTCGRKSDKCRGEDCTCAILSPVVCFVPVVSSGFPFKINQPRKVMVASPLGRFGVHIGSGRWLPLEGVAGPILGRG